MAIRLMMVCACVSMLVLSANWSAAGEKVRVGRKIPTSQQMSINRIDHRGWDRLLRRYVDDAGNVNYRLWKRTPADIEALGGYLNHLSTANAQTPASHEAKLAFWINAYNSVTIWGILREYPTASIRNHTAKVFGYNIWHDLLLRVGNEEYSLDQIEHQVLRKMGEPRIHFAIVCASKSCPRLLAQAYTSQALERQLTHNARAFFADSANFRYDERRGQFYLSAILKWFAADFGRTKQEQLRYFAPYLPTAQAYRAAVSGSPRISHLEYDWSLNDQAALRGSTSSR